MSINKLGLLTLVPLTVAFGCTRDPGENAPPDKPVTQVQISKMTPEQRAGYDQAMKSREMAQRATRGAGGAPKTNGP